MHAQIVSIQNKCLKSTISVPGPNFPNPIFFIFYQSQLSKKKSRFTRIKSTARVNYK